MANLARRTRSTGLSSPTAGPAGSGSGCGLGRTLGIRIGSGEGSGVGQEGGVLFLASTVLVCARLCSQSGPSWLRMVSWCILTSRYSVVAGVEAEREFF